MAADERRNESELIYELILPLLKRVAHSVQSLELGEVGDIKYSSDILYEFTIKDRGSRPGRRSQVDFLMSARPPEDSVFRIAVEAKSEIYQKHMSQLAQHQCSLQSTETMKQKMSIGLLLGQNKVQISFSPWGCDKIPLPVVIVSPPLSWRKGLIIDRATCINLCLVQTLFTPRVTVDRSDVEKVFGENMEYIDNFTHKLAGQAVAEEGLDVQHQPLDLYQHLYHRVQTLEERLQILMSKSGQPAPLTLSTPSPRKSTGRRRRMDKAIFVLSPKYARIHEQ